MRAHAIPARGGGILSLWLRHVAGNTLSRNEISEGPFWPK